jgi:hypothetical protein
MKRLLLLTVTVLSFLAPLNSYAVDTDANETETQPTNTGMSFKECMTKYSDSQMCTELAILDGTKKTVASSNERTSETSERKTPATPQ